MGSIQKSMINLKFIFLIFAYLICHTHAFSQNHWSKLYDIAKASDAGWKLISVGEYYYIMAANICSPNSNFCTGLIKIDQQGNVIWKQIIDSVSPSSLNCMVSDGSSIYLTLRHNIQSTNNFRLLKFDLNGNLIKEKRYPIYPVQRFSRTLNYHQNKIYVNVLFWHDPFKPGNDSAQLWTFDTDFNEISKFSLTDKYFSEILYNFESTKDGYFLSTKFFSKDAFWGSAKLIKFDSLGRKKWDVILPETLEELYYQFPLAAITPDTGSVVCWMQQREYRYRDTSEFSPILYKYDRNGNLQWSRVYYALREQIIYNLFVTDKGDIITLGKDDNPGRYSPNFRSTGWVTRVSPDGIVKWDRRIEDYRDLTTSRFYSGVEAKNGDLILCGSLVSFSEDSTYASADAWVLRIDSNGCYNGYCDTFAVISGLKKIEENAYKEKVYNIYPNPAKDYFYVLSKEDIPQYTELVLYNSSGKFVTNRPIHSREEKIHLENYPKGIYYYRIKVRDKTTQIGKLIVI